MVDNFELGESKYGRIYKVAGPCKYFLAFSLTLALFHSGRRGEHVRLQNVRARQGRLGQTGRRDHQARRRYRLHSVLRGHL